MYNIYVTNNSGRDVYVRLHRQTISSLNESFHHELDKLTGRERSETSSGVNSFLVRWGFCIIPSKATMPFAVEDADEIRMYASLYAKSQLWIMDYEVNCTRYGCVFVKGKKDGNLSGANQLAKSKSDGAVSGSAKCSLYLSLANPEPVWISKEKGGLLVQGEKFIKTGIGYFGRSSVRGGTPCRVTTDSKSGIWLWDTWYTVSDDHEKSGELLQYTAHEFIRAKSGDPIPPHAVIVGISDTDGSLYLGRVGGNIPCSISTSDDGKIKCFCYFSGEEKRAERGEIMVLTGGNAN